jgi:ABC-type multidrug transport system fused ATPase/permease subunit
MIGDRSAVYISHRLASTQFCDRIALFKDGKLTEYGTHDELMSRNGAYADMFNTQAQYYRDEQDRRKAFEGEEVKNDE